MFTDPFESVIISGLADNSAELLDSVPAESESGWDSMRLNYLVRNEAAGVDPTLALTTTELAAVFDRGTQIPAKNMWIVSRAPRLRARGWFEVEVLAMGLLSPRGYKVSYDSSAASQSAENVATPDGTFARVQTLEATPTCQLEYILIGTAPSSTSFPTYKTGRAHAPGSPWTPSVPPTVWASLSEFTYHWPNGWVMDGAAAENLPGLSTVFLMRERFTFRYGRTP